MRLKKKSLPTKNTLLSMLALLLLAGGLYLLYVALIPEIDSLSIKSTNNSTTKKLSRTKKSISENRLYIPKIDINLPYQAGSEGVMEHGAWWRVPENGNPKDGGNFVLSAHRFIMGLTPQQTLRKSPFYNIDKLKIGDELIVDYDGKRYTYVIEKVFDVKPDAIEIENRTNEPQLTLYSCTLGGANDGRNVIVAKLK